MRIYNKTIKGVFILDSKNYFENNKTEVSLCDDLPKSFDTIIADSEYTLATSKNNTVNDIVLYEEKIPTKYLKPSDMTTLHSQFSFQLAPNGKYNLPLLLILFVENFLNDVYFKVNRLLLM